LNRFDLLERAVACIDVPHDLYIIDNSVVNRGVAASWNAIMREAFSRGYDWVFVGNNDCFVNPGALQLTIDRLGTDGVGIWHIHYWSLFAISRQTVERAGWFDEDFWPIYYEDNDYHRRCELAGVTMRQVPEASAVHLQEMALKSGFVGRDNRPYYIRKWGGPPGEERFTTPFGIQEARADRRRAAAARRA
jgi:GT2 family glycosyltransferase